MRDHPFFAGEHPVAFAHRGGAALWPENTMAAFRGAVEMGYRYVETDLCATADGVLVAIHDTTLDRTTDGSGPVAARAWEELAGLDAGYRFQPERDHPWRGKGVGIPRLEEVLTELPETRFTLELKQDGLEEALVDLVRGLGAEDRVLVGAFEDARLKRVRRLSKGSILTSSGRRETAAIWCASRVALPLPTPAKAVQVPTHHRGVRVVDRRMVAAARLPGRQLHVWTIDDAETMHGLLDLGVDGIMTDRPDVLKAVLEERRRRG